MVWLVLACSGEPAGGPCGQGPFGDAAAPGAWYVDATAEPGGDGSQDAPLQRLDQVPDGAHAVLAEGVYALQARSGVVDGRCREMVRLQGEVVVEHELELSGVTLEGATVTASGRFACLRCDVVESPGYPLVVDGGWARLEDSRVLDVRTDLQDHAIALLSQGEGAVLELEGVVVDGVRGHGAVARYGGRLVLDQVAIRRLHSPSTEVFALYANEGGQVEGRQVQVVSVDGIAVVVHQAALDIDGLYVADVFGEGVSAGVAVLYGGTATLADVEVLATSGAAIAVGELGWLELHEATIDGTTRGFFVDSGGDDPMDIAALPGSTLIASGLRLQSEEAFGLIAKGAQVELRDSWLGPSDFGGIWSVSGSWVVLDGVTVEGRTGTAVGAGHDGVLVGRDVSVRDTVRPELLKLAAGFASVSGATLVLEDAEALRTEGYGLIAEDATVSLAGGRVEDSLLAGALCGNQAICELHDLAIARVEPEPASMLSMGLFVGSYGSGATAQVSGLQVDEGGMAGVWVERGELWLSDGRVAGAPPVDLLPGVPAYGHAVYVREGVAHLSGMELHDAGGAGLFLHAAQADLEHCELHDNAIDLVVQACEGEVEAPPDLDAELCPEWEYPTVPMSFFGIVDLSSG